MAAGDEPVAAWRWRSMQVIVAGVLSTLLLGLLVLLGLNAFRQSEEQARVAAFSMTTESTATNVVSIMRESLDHVATVERWLAGAQSRRSMQITRALLAQRLAVRDRDGQDGAAAVTPTYLTSLRALDSALATAPAGLLPEASRDVTRARVDPIVLDFASEARQLTAAYQRHSDRDGYLLAEAEAAAHRTTAILLLATLVVAAGLLTWIAVAVIGNTRRARGVLADEARELAQARTDLAHASLLERGQAEILEEVATGAATSSVLRAVVELAAAATDRAFVLTTPDGTWSSGRPEDADAAGGAPTQVLWAAGFGHDESGTASGELALLGHPGDLLDDEAARTGHLCCGLATVVVDRDRAALRLTHQATHDALTGLANRALLLDRLDEAMQCGGPRTVAVLFCDLDGFKLVNDSLGHKAGDRLLVEAAERLQAAVRHGDMVARLGGDEFVVLCESLEDQAAAPRLAERISAAFATPFRVDDREAFVGVSVGIAYAAGADTAQRTTAAALLRDADVAMYRAKRRDRGPAWAVFDAAMESEAATRLETDTALRRAVDRGELRLVLQPVVRMSDGQPTGAEALVRWQRPRLGETQPNDFIPLAEENGLVVSIGRWVLRESLQWLALRDRAGADDAITVAVNVSGRQLRDPGFEEDVLAALVTHGIDPQRLVLELTEHTLIEAGDAARTLARLRSLGVRVALDDFGTGYSSLTQLRTLPVDIIKLDRSFVAPLTGAGEGHRAVVAAVVRLADALDLQLVVEGVETEAERQILLDLGCTRGQGFLFGRPEAAPGLSAATSPGR